MHCGTYPSDINSKLSMFFLRTTVGAVQLPNNLEEAHLSLPQYFDFGILNSHPLFMLSQTLTKVIILLYLLFTLTDFKVL